MRGTLRHALGLAPWLVACGPAPASVGPIVGDAGSATDAYVAPATCESHVDTSLVHLAVSASLPPGADVTRCYRYTTPVALDITRFVGTLGPAGHHSLLLGYTTPQAQDGLADCDEQSLMDARSTGAYEMLAGVSYETDGVAVSFPSAPVQVGLHVDAGTQLVFDAHFLNAASAAESACATLDLSTGAPVYAALQFHTVLPAAEYGLSIPAGQTITVGYDDPVPGSYRVAAASSHMHQGGLRFAMTVKETGTLVYGSSSWSDPAPRTLAGQTLVVSPGQHFHLDCTFENGGAAVQRFPSQMCVGGMYLLPCSLPGACD